jgi:hypothetical protein
MPCRLTQAVGGSEGHNSEISDPKLLLPNVSQRFNRNGLDPSISESRPECLFSDFMLCGGVFSVARSSSWS